MSHLKIQKSLTILGNVNMKGIVIQCGSRVENKITKQKGITLRQTYTRTLKQLMIDQCFHSHPKRRKKARVAFKKSREKYSLDE